MNKWKLPTSLEVGGTSYRIRTDYRDVLTILRAFGDPDLPAWAKTQVMLEILFPDWESIPAKDMEEAAREAVRFIDNGNAPPEGSDNKPTLMDWEQDAEMIAPAVNKVMGHGDIRALEYLHWWTFLGYYMEIGEGLFSTVLQIRQKRAKGKKLEKWEREFYHSNRKLIDIKARVSEEELARRQAEEAALKELWG